MVDMDLQIAIDESRPLRAQVEREIREGIRAGRLRAGARLPASRPLAQELRVSRGVIVEAYAQLIAEGYLSARRSGGTRVAGGASRPAPHRSPHHPSPPRIRFDLRAGIPDLSLFPRRAWHAATVAALRELPDASLSYGPPQGLGYLRRTLADYLGRVRAVLVESDQIFITCGTSHSLALLWHALARRGVRRVAVEDPTWRRIPETIAQAGLEPVAVAVDGAGLVVGDLARLDVDAVVVSPAHQYPTGA
jgi:GntR family transcriptional regulator / MocR family aminotransferase